MTEKETWSQALIILRCKERNPQIIVTVCRKAQIFATAVKILKLLLQISQSNMHFHCVVNIVFLFITLNSTYSRFCVVMFVVSEMAHKNLRNHKLVKFHVHS